MADTPRRAMTLPLDALRMLWRTRERLVLLQAGFGDGSAFLQLWQAWLDDAQQRAQIVFIAIDPAFGDATALRRAHAGSVLEAFADRLAAHWPPLTPNLHRLDIDAGRLQLLLAPGELLSRLPELQARVDAFLIGAVDLTADSALGPKRLAKGLARLAASGAQLWAATPQWAHELGSAGFALLSPNDDGLQAVYRPHFAPRRPPLASPISRDRHALIVGAGLAGCALACALAEQGWRSTLIERADAPATMASGNPAGLFHGSVNAQDGAHARFNRAAALQARPAVRLACDSHGALGSTAGLLRLESSLPGVAAMQAVIDALRLPADYVQALDAETAGRLCGLPLRAPAWFYPGGGWVQPAALARSFLQRAGAMTRFRGGLSVHSLQQADDRWVLLDEAGHAIDHSATVVLANAADALRVLGTTHWPVQSVRGQLSLCDNRSAAQPPLKLPRIPVAGAGYLLPAVEGLGIFGASTHPGDADPDVRAADHRFNLQRLRALSGQPGPDPDHLLGRVGWRLVADDRLPLIGAAPDERSLGERRIERLGDMPRRPGLFVFAALASRGIGWAALGAQVVAAQISGAPVPLEASLLRAIDPARFALRSARLAAV